MLFTRLQSLKAGSKIFTASWTPTMFMCEETMENIVVELNERRILYHLCRSHNPICEMYHVNECTEQFLRKIWPMRWIYIPWACQMPIYCDKKSVVLYHKV